MALIYKCGICGKSYNTIKERNECEMNCIAASERAAAEKKKKEAEAKKAALEKVKKSKAKEIENTFTKASELINAYVKEYDEFPEFKIELEGETIDFNDLSKKLNVVDRLFNKFMLF